MHIPLYQALKSVRISDDRAADVVKTTEEFMAVKISEANKGLEARFGAVESELKSIKWLLGFIGVLIAITGLAPAIAKLF